MASPRQAHGSADRRGTALIVSLFVTVVVLGVVVTGTSVLKANRARTETAFLLTGQAAHFARSGLIEAVNWFRRQPTQPVLAFAPQLDTSADPQVLDTEDPDIGLMREFRIHGRIWGRYEVWKRWDDDPVPERLSWRQRVQAEDLSLERGRPTAGNVWRLRGVGYVFDRHDPTVSFRTYPNRVLATEILEAEISRLAIALPGQAALCCSRGDQVNVKKNGRVLGGSDAAGVFYKQDTGSPSVASGSEITGVPDLASSSVYDDSIRYVFGVGPEELRSIADVHVQNEKDFPSPLPEASLVVLDGTKINMKFDSKLKLEGNGIVVIRGDVLFNAGSSSFFNGLLYVEGDLDIHAPVQLTGAVVVTGNVTLQGIGDFAEVRYDEDVLTRIHETIASYGFSRPPRRLMRQD